VLGFADTGRLEAFSDGVFAIAITLLILDVGIKEGPSTLAHRLGAAWPSYVSFLISFAVIGTMWLNHHQMFRLIASVDHTLVVTNLALLLVATAIPFTTRVLGSTLAHGSAADQRTAALTYGLSFVATGVVFPLLWWSAVRDGGRLLIPGVRRRDIRARTRLNLIGGPSFVLATALALWNATATVIALGLIMSVYLVPEGWFLRHLGGEQVPPGTGEPPEQPEHVTLS
jgi:uncharacterized membrane protein